MVNRRESPAAAERRGGILLVVLGVLAAMGVVVSLLASYALERSLLAETRGAEASTEAAERLSGAIEASLAVLGSFEEVAGSFRHPGEGWGKPAELLEGWPAPLRGVEVRVFDESSRPGLSRLGEGELETLLEESGFSRGEAAELRDLLLDWIDEDDDERLQGRENERIGSRRDPWVANRPPEGWEEVWAIPEWGEAALDEDRNLREWARRFSTSFSLEHDLPANVNTVDAGLVEWLDEADLIADPGWLDERDGPDNRSGSADDRILSEVPEGEAGDLFSSESRLLRIRAGLRVGQRFVWKEVWISRGEGDGEANRGGEDEEEPAGGRGGDAGRDAFSPWGGWEIAKTREGLSLVLDDSEAGE